MRGLTEGMVKQHCATFLLIQRRASPEQYKAAVEYATGMPQTKGMPHCRHRWMRSPHLLVLLTLITSGECVPSRLLVGRTRN